VLKHAAQHPTIHRRVVHHQDEWLEFRDRRRRWCWRRGRDQRHIVLAPAGCVQAHGVGPGAVESLTEARHLADAADGHPIEHDRGLAAVVFFRLLLGLQRHDRVVQFHRGYLHEERAAVALSGALAPYLAACVLIHDAFRDVQPEAGAAAALQLVGVELHAL
jgi:hypothetical protein